MYQPRGREAYVEHVEGFTTKLRTLSRDLARRYPADANASRLHKRITTGVSADPVSVIEAVGPYLYKYREQIYSADAGSAVSRLLACDFAAELSEGGQERTDIIRYLIPKARECAGSLSDAELVEYTDIVVAMLDDYLEYLAATLPRRG
jgi:hypothetical protein